MTYQRDFRSGARAIIEAGEQFLAPAPRMQTRALRRRRLQHRDMAWRETTARPPSLVRIAVLGVFAALAFACQVVFLARTIA